MRLLIVSNRLPVSLSEEKGELKFHGSVGGLVTGLSAYLNSLNNSSSGKMDYLWVGWPGMSVKGKKREEVISKLLEGFSSYPVFLPERVIDKFYYGFCNKTLWPLFHYFPSYTSYDEEQWKNYKQVNETFCEAVSRILEPGDIVWIHDYHLMLLPGLIKQRFPNNPIGFFLHIPFPTFEVFRLLPSEWRKEILEGLLGSTLVGFHTNDYTHYFLRCVLRILGYEHSMGQILIKGRIAKAETFPMGIDFQKFYNSMLNPEVQREKALLEKVFGGQRVILSVDRLDYTKGIVNRLRGYEEFLNSYPSWQGRVILVLLVAPSRVRVEHYQQMKRQIDELVGEINGKLGNIDWTPILYSYKYIPFSQLVALYNISDVALITPLRDGMNLIAKEYVSTKSDGKGVLVLSEMAGASKEAGEAIIINPNNVNEIANALCKALEMPEEEQIRRNHMMQLRLRSYNVFQWAEDFIQTLISVWHEQENLHIKLLGSAARGTLVDAYNKAKRRLVLLDYDGTLVPFTERPELANPNQKLLDLLRHLSRDPKNEVILISGRCKETLEGWFGDLEIGLMAEHGVWIRERGGEWRNPKVLTKDWIPKVQPILKVYADRIPGSFVETKEYSLVWHYRMADPGIASIKAMELVDDLLSFTANIDVQVIQGNKIVEVRNAGVNKGDAVQQWLSKNKYDFILALGDDLTDEDMFRSLPKQAYTIRVGLAKSNARFNIDNYSEAIELLETFLI